MQLIYLFLFLTPIQQCFAQRKIHGGKLEKISNLPFIVKIYILGAAPGNKVMLKNCGGTYIHKIWVLTAAHCISYQIPKGPRLGSCCMGTEVAEYKSCTNERKIKKFIMHPNSKDVDLLLVQIESAFVLGKTIQFATLPDRPLDLQEYAGVACTAAGWGLTAADAEDSKELKSAEVVVKSGVSHAMCRKEAYICTEGENQGTCQGDSGGPLVCKGVVVGVLNGGDTVCGKISFWVNVGLELKFVNQMISGNGVAGVSIRFGLYAVLPSLVIVYNKVFVTC